MIKKQGNFVGKNVDSLDNLGQKQKVHFYRWVKTYMKSMGK
jgi:hypothetical protein